LPVKAIIASIQLLCYLCVIESIKVK